MADAGVRESEKLDKKLLCIMGHGLEIPRKFEERKQCPHNVTLVTFAQTGDPIWLLFSDQNRDSEREYIIPLISDSSNIKYLKNPVKYKKIINNIYYKNHIIKNRTGESIAINDNSIRIYRPGDNIPDIRTSLVFEHNAGGDCFVTSPTGVLEIPVKMKRTPVEKLESVFGGIKSIHSKNLYHPRDIDYNLQSKDFLCTGSHKFYSVYNILLQLSEDFHDKHVIVYLNSCRVLPDIDKIEHTFQRYILQKVYGPSRNSPITESTLNTTENPVTQRILKFMGNNFLYKNDNFPSRKRNPLIRDVTPDIKIEEHSAIHNKFRDSVDLIINRYEELEDFIDLISVRSIGNDFETKANIDLMNGDDKILLDNVRAAVESFKRNKLDRRAESLAQNIRDARQKSDKQQDIVDRRSSARRKSRRKFRIKTRRSRHSRELSLPAAI